MRFRCHGCGARFGVMESRMRVAHVGIAVVGLLLFGALMPFRALLPFPIWLGALVPSVVVLWAVGALAWDLYRDAHNPRDDPPT